MECGSVCNKLFSLEQIPNLFAEVTTFHKFQSRASKQVESQKMEIADQQATQEAKMCRNNQQLIDIITARTNEHVSTLHRITEKKLRDISHSSDAKTKMYVRILRGFVLDESQNLKTAHSRESSVIRGGGGA